MAIILDLTPRQLLKISVTFKPATVVVQDIVTDGSGEQLLDGDGNPVFGWVEE